MYTGLLIPILTNFSRLLESLLDLAIKENKLLVVCGDYNIDTLQTSSSTRDLKSALLTSNFKSLIHLPTRVTDHSSTCLDNFLTNIPHINSTGVIQTDISDHYPIFVDLAIYNPEKTHRPKLKAYRRDTTNHNKTLFVKLISNHDWSSIIKETDVNNKYNIFINTFTQYMNSCFPLRLHNIDSDTKNPWLNSEIKQLNSIKNSLYLLSIRNTRLKPHYNCLNKRYKRTIKSMKRNHYQNIITKNKNNPRKTWKTLNTLTGRHTSKTMKSPVLQQQNKTFSDPKVVADLFNNHFCNIGDSLNLKTMPPSPPTQAPPPQQKSFALFEITENEIINSIKLLKTSSSPGYDQITTELLQLTLPYISKILLHIFNTSFKEGTFPSRMKTAKVIPIYKKGKHTDVNNYRPISLLPSLSKCLERIMHNRLSSFLTHNNAISHSQFGFTKNKNTVDAMATFMEKITTLSKRNHTISIFCDLTKAFDCVNHDILLHKLFNIGIRGLPLKWFRSYLTDRNQFTTLTAPITYQPNQKMLLTSHESSLKPVKRGVPQGSILGPLLFNIYINDLPLSNSSTNDFILYADDTNILISDDDPLSLKLKLNSALSSTINWLNSNQLCLNSSKTNFMYINTNNKNPDPEPSSHSIERIYETKFLGLTITSDLNWKPHIHKVANKIKPAIAMLYKLRSTLDSKTLLHIYHSLIHSHLNYAILIWGGAPQSHLDPLLKLQKKAIRIIDRKDPLTSCRPLFKKYNILTIISLYVLEASYYAKRRLLQDNHNYHDTAIQTTNNIHTHFTRQQNLIYIQNNTRPKSDIVHKCSKIYNKLPDYLKTIQNLNKFRAETKKHLLQSTLYTLREF